MDFATSVIPGWHTTIFPPYFVAGAIFSGFAMVLTLMLVTRVVFKLEDYITIAHIESMNKVILRVSICELFNTEKLPRKLRFKKVLLRLF
jgi:Ni/Fe-hydrogenase subunit HybB-like protein